MLLDISNLNTFYDIIAVTKLTQAQNFEFYRVNNNREVKIHSNDNNLNIF